MAWGRALALSFLWLCVHIAQSLPLALIVSMRRRIDSSANLQFACSLADTASTNQQLTYLYIEIEVMRHLKRIARSHFIIAVEDAKRFCILNQFRKVKFSIDWASFCFLLSPPPIACISICVYFFSLSPSFFYTFLSFAFFIFLFICFGLFVLIFDISRIIPLGLLCIEIL